MLFANSADPDQTIPVGVLNVCQYAQSIFFKQTHEKIDKKWNKVFKIIRLLL